VLVFVDDGCCSNNYEVEPNQIRIRKHRQHITSVSLRKNADYGRLANLDLGANELQMEDLERLSTLNDLQYLDVSWNKIAGTLDLALLGRMDNLKHCWLASNQIDKLTNTFDGQQSKMTDLVLSHNHLETVDMAIFKPFTKLRFLWLNMNRLYRMDGYAEAKVHMPDIYLISVLENNWICSDLQKIVKSFEKDSILFHSLEEHSCSANKKRVFGVACCYPNVEDLRKDSEEFYVKYVENI
jgi:hypothetical protein